MAYAFRGGIFFTSDKKTKDGTIERPAPPKTLLIPLKDVSRLTVPVGSRVLCGQLLALPQRGTAAIHSPVSGTVAAVEPEPFGVTVRIENDGTYELSPDIRKMDKKLADCTAEEIIDRIAVAGIVDSDGGEPVSEKLTQALGHVDTCIINCVATEPYISCDGRVAAEDPAAVVNGLKIFLRALGIRRGVIALSEGDPEVSKKIGGMVKNSRMISVVVCRAKYPQEDAKRLVYAVTGHELPAGADPSARGCVIFNVQACAAVYNAFVTGMPQTKRVVTVSGDCVRRPVNVEVPIGTRFSELLEYAGGTTREPDVILDGGPLSGHTASLNFTVGKTTKALLLMSERMTDKYNGQPVCIKCGRCVSACPERLMPNYLYNYLRDGKTREAVDFGILSCVGCGLCSYICPGKAPVAELIADFKRKHNEKKRSDDEAVEADA